MKEEGLKKQIREALEQAMYEDWVWDGENENRIEEFNMNEATESIFLLFKKYKDAKHN